VASRQINDKCASLAATVARAEILRDTAERSDDKMMPRRTWWMKRHDTINFVILAVILAFIVWTAIFP